jgi:hypothetical protein
VPNTHRLGLAALLLTAVLTLSACGATTSVHKVSTSGGKADTAPDKAIAVLNSKGGPVTFTAPGSPYTGYFKRGHLPAGCHPSKAHIIAVLKRLGPRPTTMSVSHLDHALCD